MSGVNYKEYSPEESRIYNDTMEKIKAGLRTGLTFSEVCSAVRVEDSALRDLILDDALKVMIAEMHYGKGLTLKQVAEALGVPINKINLANREMLEDVSITATEFYKQTYPESPIGNA